MKKTIAIIFTLLSIILILDSMNAGYAITMFLLAGVIPGTNISMSAAQMLELFALLFGFVLARISVKLSQTYIAYRNTTKLAALNSHA